VNVNSHIVDILNDIAYFIVYYLATGLCNTQYRL